MNWVNPNLRHRLTPDVIKEINKNINEKMNSKEFYKTYLADDNLTELNEDLIDLIIDEKPNHVFEFGCGTGKNINIIQHEESIPCTGLDISFINTSTAKLKHNINCVITGDETHLRHLCNYDVVFTCSVLDHVPEEMFIDIVAELKRIANKCVFVAETNSYKRNHYYQHDYEAEGFVKVGEDYIMDNVTGNGAIYSIWKWVKENEIKTEEPCVGAAE